MANVSETSNFDEGIYQLETTDQVEGGALGISNAQAKGLANRTRWLYNRIVELLKFSPKNRGYFTGLDVNGSTGSLGVSGDIVSASASILEGGDGSNILVTMQNSMGNTNYMVRSSIQSLGSSISDTDINPIVFATISPTQFRIYIQETSNTSVQNLRVHLEIISLD